MLKAAFNMLIKLHSRQAQIKRLGSPDIYSPCRVCPSNYFRYLRGPEATVIRGREFIIPLDTALGQFGQTITFSSAAASGTFKIQYNGNKTSFLSYNASASQIQTALRFVPSLSQVLVSGSVATALTITFQGFQSQPLSLSVTDSTLLNSGATAVTAAVSNAYQPWTGEKIKRGDKLIDTVFGVLTVDETVEMVDLGGTPMGMRVRCD